MPNSAQEILAALRAQGVAVRGVSADSRRIEAGDLFVALPGRRSDGRRHIEDALARGAAAVVWEAGTLAAEADDLAQQLARVPHVTVTGLQKLTGALAHEVYGHPSAQLWLCGITGTNGKTTVSQWIAQAMAGLARRCGVIGTLGNGLPGALQESTNTTPDAISTHAELARIRAQGAQACAMEVSSIGLDQGRVDALCFDTVVFTNLTRDHLEYHGNMMAYATAKARLFARSEIRTAVLNLDDPLGVVLAHDLAGRQGSARVRRIGYTLDEACPNLAGVDEFLMARNLEIRGDRLAFSVASNTTGAEAGAEGATVPTAAAQLEVPLLGRFNVANLLAVLGALLGAGVPWADALESLTHLRSPAGRLQIVATDAARAEPLLVVDYAHTPDALEQVLKTLREVATARGGRLCCVFGCGGERDAGKRPLMGGVAERFADVVLVTSDNPRAEDALKIMNEILNGMRGRPQVEADRAAAIAQTVSGLQVADVLLIAGKGHERYQEVAGQRHAFSDVEQAHQALLAWRVPT
ncbi:MAG: UDP-N-acetylmuramoyl-L-alanyl-D-glutamate--2,6-diaminopimelate ligase [Sterolibacterium sp.]|nr:UDP-N-acetylmuramoyl-L-alanyl-D-glutamate--2,6-diaminopimelate ligase [Sterolibacterium sp.]